MKAALFILGLLVVVAMAWLAGEGLISVTGCRWAYLLGLPGAILIGKTYGYWWARGGK